MIVQLSIAASGLPDESANYFASISVDGEVVGRTGVITGNGSFAELVVLPEDEESPMTAQVQIFAEADETAIVAQAVFDASKIARSYVKTGVKVSDAGPIIAVHATEQTHNKLRVVLQAQDLPNTDFSFLNKKQCTDPFYEIYNHLGKLFDRSNRVEDNLNPVWDERCYDLEQLCGASLTMPLRITVSDKDGGGKSEYLGNVALSVQEMIDGVAVELLRGGSAVGEAKISAQVAELLADVNVPRSAKVALQATLDAVADLEKLKENSRIQMEEAQAAKVVAEEAKEAAQAKQAAADVYAKQHLEVETKLASMVTQAAEISLKAETKEFSGTVKLTLAAQNLTNTDFGFRNKSDPIYEIFKGETKVLCSNRVEDNLNPVWQEQTFDLDVIDTLDTPLKIIVSDKDGGGNKTSLGIIELSVNELINTDPQMNLPLQDQPKSSSEGVLLIQQAELVDFVNMKEQAEKLKAECESMAIELDAAAQSFRAAQEEADEASKNAAEAAEKAFEEQQEAEAADAAVKAAELTE